MINKTLLQSPFRTSVENLLMSAKNGEVLNFLENCSLKIVSYKGRVWKDILTGMA